MNFKDLWGNLKFNAGDPLSNLASALNWRIKHNNKSPIVYKNRRYKSVVIHTAKQLAMSEIEHRLNDILPKFKAHLEKEKQDKMWEKKEAFKKQLISNTDDVSQDWGVLRIENNKEILAQDKYGRRVKESLILSYDSEESREVKVMTYANYEKSEITYKTNKVWIIDLAPQISMSSTKNLILTQVQGRDFSRKELISGGDFQFSFSGNLVSDNDHAYPVNEVRKFKELMTYGGVLDVNHMMLAQFGVKKLIIKDFSLSHPEFINMQPYSFTAVAIEPDDDLIVKKDTISIINTKLQENSTDKWYELVLKNKLANTAANVVLNNTKNVIVDGVGIGFDELIPNI